jgi:hypothetical protein
VAEGCSIVMMVQLNHLYPTINMIVHLVGGSKRTHSNLDKIVNSVFQS